MNQNILNDIARELLNWPGVTEVPGRFNSIEYRYGKREIGHIHGNGVADLPFTRAIHDDLIASGRAYPHQAGSPSYVTVPIHREEDVPNVVELFRMNYERAKASADQREKSRA